MPADRRHRPPADVSVIVPAKDRERFVAEAVRSALGQEGCRVEVIVVDDRSADGTAAAVGAILDERVRLLEGPGRGPGAARNVAIRAARSPLLAFLDSDDVFEPGKLARQLELLAARPDAGLAYTGHAFFGDVVPPPRPEGPEDRLADGYGKLFLRPYFLTSSVVARREVIEAAGAFDERLPLVEDYDLYLRAAAAAAIVGDPAALVRVRRHSSNLTSGDRLRLAILRKRVVRRNLERFGSGVPPPLERWRLANLEYTIGALLLERAERKRSRLYFARARRSRPFWLKAWKGTVAAMFG